MHNIQERDSREYCELHNCDHMTRAISRLITMGLKIKPIKKHKG